MAGNVTLKEIAEQFDVWKDLIADMELLQKDVDLNFQVKEYDEVLFVGAGSSYHLAVAAATSFHLITGDAALAVPSSEIMLFHRYHLKKDRKYIAIFFSRSGGTTETLEALNVLKNNYRTTSVAISCDPVSVLCKECDMSFPVKNCIEQSHIMTKSFTGMLFVSYMFAAAFGDRFTSLNILEQLPDEGRASFEWQRRAIDTAAAGAPLDRITLLGGGPFAGLVGECGLKLDEVAGLRTKVYTPLEMRHGPHLAVGSGDLIILFLTPEGASHEAALLAELKAKGAKTLVFSTQKVALPESIVDYWVLAGRGMPDFCRGILYMSFIQYFACVIAVSRGIDPDNIPGMTRVVKL